jgi:lipoprotein NlpD
MLMRIAIAALLLSLAACATRVRAPVEERSSPPAPPMVAPTPAPEPATLEPEPRVETYTVKRGDTLYAIALDHGLDYRELAAWNNIENINVIRVGQVLRVVPPGESTAAGVQTMPLRTVPPVAAGDASPAPGSTATGAAASGMRNTDIYKTQPKAIKEPYSQQAMRDVERSASSLAAPAPPAPEVAPPPVVASIEPRAVPRPAPTKDDDLERLEWVWPTKGKIVTGFSEATSLKGIDIAGSSGQAVAASAGGKVVYAGTGLRGYGKLVIIKHNGTYLSAYAHNREIVVKEGQQVTRGQKIAEMGNTDADQVKLHFEIRQNGKPVDPLKYLPPA